MSPTGHWTFLRRLLACSVAVLLFWGGYLGQVLAPYNRMYFQFGWLDTAALLVLLGGCGLGAALVLHILSKCTRGRSDIWLSPWFYFWVVQTGFNFFPVLRQELIKHWPWLSGTIYYLIIWGFGILLTATAYVWPRMRKMAASGWRAVSVAWPLLLLLPASLLLARHWPRSDAVPPKLGRNLDGRGPAVVIIILDMVGYDDLFDAQGHVYETYPAIQGFARTATVYRQAQSSGDLTALALPGLMFQEEVGDPLLTTSGVRWRPADEPEACPRLPREFPNLLPRYFTIAGGRAVYMGYYLPYAEIMPGVWDSVYSPGFYGVVPKNASSRWGRVLWRQMVNFLDASKDPIAGIAKQFSLYLPMVDRYHRQLTLDIFEAGKTYILNDLSPGDFSIIHLAVPHPPIVFNAEGGPSLYDREDSAGYPDQLRYADRLFEELLVALQETDNWSDNWVVMLSDHGSHFKNWDSDPKGKRHVPLMIKAPGQTMQVEWREPFRIVDIYQLPGFCPIVPERRE